MRAMSRAPADPRDRPFQRPVPALLVTLAAVAAVEVFSRAAFRLPTLTPFLAIVAYVAFQYGQRAGLISAGIVSLYGVYYLATPVPSLTYTPENALRLASLPVTAVIVALLVGSLRAAVRAREDDLRRRLEFSRAIDDSLAEGVYAIDREGRATFVNPAAERLLGWTSAELLGRVMHDAIHYRRPDGTPYPREECDGLQVLRSGAIYRTEDDAFIRKDGTFLPVAYSSAPLLRDGRVEGAVVAFRDIGERRRAAEALRRSEERFSALVRNSSDVIAVVDARGAILYISPAIERVLGYPPAGLVGARALEAMPPHPDDFDRVRPLFADFLDTPAREVTIEVRQRHADGTWRTLEVTVKNLLHDPSVGGIVLNLRDVTARRRAEAALRESEATLRLINAQIPAHIWTTDADLCVTSVLGAGLARLGRDPSMFVGRTLDEFFQDEGADTPGFVAHRRALAGELAEYERHSGGRTFACRVEPLRDAAGRVVGCLGLALDVTERKWHERRLATQYEVGRALAEATDLDEATPRILRAIGEGLAWDYGALWTVDRRDNVLRCVAAWHTPAADFPEFIALSRRTAFAPGEGLPGSVWATGEPRWVAEAVDEERFPRLRVAAAEGLRAGAGLPIRLDGQVLGVLEFLSRQPREADPAALAVLGSLGGQIGQFVERRRAEAALRRSEASLAEAQRIAHLGHWEYASESGEGHWSAEVYRILGHAPGAITPTQEFFYESVHPDDRAAVQGAIEDAFAGGAPLGLDFRIVRPDGEVRTVHEEAEIARDRAGRPLRLVGTIHDITERKRAEEQLAARARQQAAVAAFGRRALATPDLDAILDEAAQLVAATLDVGYSKVLELPPDGDALLLQAGAGWREGYVGRATVSAGPETQGGYSLTRREPVIVEDFAADPRFIRPPLLRDHGIVSSMSVLIPGTERPFGVLQADSATPRRFTPDDSNFLQAVANVIAAALERRAFERRLAEEEAATLAARAINERLLLASLREREAAEAERAEAARLAELDRLRREFISSVSHEFRTPLTSARVGVGMLEFRAADRLEPVEREVITAVRRNIERLTLYVDDLLTINQLEAGVLEIRRAPLDLRAVVGDAVGALHPLIADKGQALEVELPEALPVVGDARRLEQIFVNLLGNAHEHTPAGTRIVVTGRDEGAAVRVTVRDDGPGIPAAHLGRIFERFHRVGAEGGGSGLGLAVTRSIVELHGGRVWAESAPDAGAAFHVALPRAAPRGGRRRRGVTAGEVFRRPRPSFSPKVGGRGGPRQFLAARRARW